MQKTKMARKHYEKMKRAVFPIHGKTYLQYGDKPRILKLIHVENTGRGPWFPPKQVWYRTTVYVENYSYWIVNLHIKNFQTSTYSSLTSF